MPATIVATVDDRYGPYISIRLYFTALTQPLAHIISLCSSKVFFEPCEWGKGTMSMSHLGMRTLIFYILWSVVILYSNHYPLNKEASVLGRESYTSVQVFRRWFDTVSFRRILVWPRTSQLTVYWISLHFQLSLTFQKVLLKYN